MKQIPHHINIELRNEAGREPELVATILSEGRASTGRLKEVFIPGSTTWPSTGVEITPGHGLPVEARVHPVRNTETGELQIRTRATPALRQAVEAGATGMSVEFYALESRTTKQGIREVIRGLIVRAAVEKYPEFDTTHAEIRSENRRRFLWR